MTKVESLRAAMKQRGKRITVTAFLLKAIALAQRAHPGSRSVALPDGRVVAVDEIVAGFTVERMVNGKPSVFIGRIGAPDQKPLEVIAEELDSYAQYPISEVPVLRTQQRFSEMPWLEADHTSPGIALAMAAPAHNASDVRCQLLRQIRR